MDIVIPLSPWSRNDNTDLKYALRSFEKFMPGNKIVIIGHKPVWLKNVEYIQFRDDPQPAFRENNIYLKVKYYVDHTSIKEFIFANDDHFLLKPFDPGAPYPHTISTLVEFRRSRRENDPYKNTITNTIELLGTTQLNFDVHCPMLMSTDIFKARFDNESINWKKKYGYLFKTLYVGKQFQGYSTIDFKINDPLTEDAKVKPTIFNTLPFFSTSDLAFDDRMIALMEMLYPTKSKFER